MTHSFRPLVITISLLAGSLGAAHAQTPLTTAQVVCHGDSLTRGENASSGLGTAVGTTYPAVLARTLGPAWRVTNVGTGGWTLDLLAGEAPRKVDPLFDPRLAVNVLIIFGGTNDLGGAHRSAATAFGKLTDYCRARKRAHSWRILVVTPPVAAYPGVYPADFDAQMVKYDALIRRDWRSFADGIVDVQADFRLGAPGAEHNPAYFSDKDFTHLTDLGYAIVGHDAARAVLAPPLVGAPAPLVAPRLTFQDRAVQGRLGTVYRAALENLLRINTVPDLVRAHDASGLLTGDPALFIRAGGGYDQPWTRDASLNSWNAASLLEPTIARNSLWAVCQKTGDGHIALQRDNQWWDKVIWITAAWNHYKVTGDRKFLATAYDVAQDELALMRREHYSPTYGLFQGPAFFCDGIAGYPEPEYDPQNHSSFVLDHPYTRDMMALSTNCVYYNAYRCAAQMAQRLGRPASEARDYGASADALKASINQRLWNPEKATYGYFIHGAGPLTGKRDETQEGVGVSFAILFGVADARQAQSLLKTAHRTPHGIPTQWPHFARFSDARPGRHNVILWPMVNGMWACAAAQSGDVATFQGEAESLARLTAGSNDRFYEIYNPITGQPDGGWQGGHWGPLADQTWSATAYLRMMYQGLFGMDYQPDGLRLAPNLPPGWGPVALQGVRYRGMTLDIALQGKGARVARLLIDGKASKQAFVPATLTGRHTIKVTME